MPFCPRVRFHWLWAALVCGTFVSPCLGQVSAAVREDLLRLVPPDMGLCAIVSNLRGQAETLPNARWLKAIRESPIGESFLSSPEFAQLAKFESELKTHLDVDWRQLRDEVVGDLVILAYRPGSPGDARAEQGLLLVWVRNPALLAKVIDRLNDAQKRSGEVRELTAVDYQGKKYFQRVERDKTQFYMLQGSMFAFSSQEALLRSVIDRQRERAAETPPLVKQLERAHADQALAAVWLNPRAFDADLRHKSEQGAGQEAQMTRKFLSYWQALDAVIVTIDLGQNPEIKLSLQARQRALPASVRRFFEEDEAPSSVWSRFPADAMLRIAGRLDTQAFTDALAELTPASARANLAETGQRYIGAVLGLDLYKDVLPNLGPDWGVCVVAGAEQDDFPVAIAALAVKPGTKEIGVDQSLYKGAQVLANLAVWGYNSSHANSIKLKTLKQGKIEVQYLAGDKAFPSGVQPAFALKDGFFVLASAPEGIQLFKKTKRAAASKGIPVVDLSTSRLATFLRDRQPKVAAGLAAKTHIPLGSARQQLKNLLFGLELFDHIVLSERHEAGQVTWSLRFQEARTK